MGYWTHMPRSSLHCFMGGAGLLELVLRSWIRGWVGLPGRPGTFSFGSCHPLTYLSRPVRSASAGPLVTESTYLGAYGGAGGPVQVPSHVFTALGFSPECPSPGRGVFQVLTLVEPAGLDPREGITP